MTTDVDRSDGWPPHQPDALAAELANFRNRLASLETCIGRSPNAATGEEGDGLCRVVSELKLESRLASRKVVGGATAGAAGVVGIVELIARLF